MIRGTLGRLGRLAREVARGFADRGSAGSMAKVIAFRTLALAVNICTSLLTAAALGPSGRGEQAALVLAPGFLGGLASIGLHGSLIYNLKADPERERELLGNGILLTLIAGSLATVAGWIAEPYWLDQYSPHTILVGRLLLLVTPMIVMGWSLSGAAESRGWFGLVNRMMYLQGLATLVVLGLLMLLRLLTPTTAAFAYMLPSIASFLYLFTQVLRRMRPVFRLRGDLSSRLLRYGARLCGVDILGTLSNFIDQLIIVAFLPPSMVGTYAVALSSARVLTVVQGGISSVLFPSIAARDINTILRTVATAFRMASLLIAGIAVVGLVVGPELLMLAYGTKFAGTIMPFRVLLVAMVIDNGARILYQIYAGNDRPGLVTMFEAAAVVVMIALMLALVPAWGTIGAAGAVLGASVFRLALAIGGIPLLLKLPLPPLVFGWDDARMVRAMLSRRGAGVVSATASAGIPPADRPAVLEAAP